MMCYRDMTFCRASDCSQWNFCPRAYTEERQQGAFEWMGENAPVAFFVDPPDCYDPLLGEDLTC